MFFFYDKRLKNTYTNSKIVELNKDTKFIIFSDAHRGDGTWADDFAPNYHLLLYSLKHYYEDGFTLIELGDCNEMWKNTSFKEIFDAHSYIYELIKQFYDDKRYYLVYGNHDIDLKYQRNIVKHLYYYYKKSLEDYLPFLKGIRVYGGLILRNREENYELFLTHGHQVDIISDCFWWFSKFFIRYIIKPLQLLGVKDPTSPAKNFGKRKKIEKRLIEWTKRNNKILICGHTHRPVLPRENEVPYLNSGSCVFPHAITGLEIVGNLIMLVKWWLKPDKDGLLKISREVLEGPRDIRLYNKNN